MHSQTKIEAANANETVNTIFQMVSIAMVGLFSLAETVQFIAANMV